jgi:hypothetical protein
VVLDQAAELSWISELERSPALVWS